MAKSWYRLVELTRGVTVLLIHNVINVISVLVIMEDWLI